MSRWSRRDLLRATAAASAVAVPAVALRPGSVLAGGGQVGNDPDALDAADAYDPAEVAAGGPLMVCVHDAAGGQVSILHGTEEIVVKDRRLVGKIVRAKSGAKKV
jgi:hypothetical protein